MTQTDHIFADKGPNSMRNVPAILNVLIFVLAGLVGCRAENTVSLEQAAIGASDDSGSASTAQPIANTSGKDARAGSAPIHEITFDDINLKMQPDVAFRPWMMTDRARELDGQRVRISGYIFAGLEQFSGIKEFVLIRNKECKFGPGGQADHLVRIYLDKEVTTSYTDKVVTVLGTLKVNPYQGPDGNTWSVYDLAGEGVRVRR